jgi:CRP/FNR family transcriptional regulator, cyclic AMP receptor protein
MDRHGWIDEQLAKVPLFEGLSKKELREISSLATQLDEREGTVLTKQGALGNEFIIIIDGEAEVQIDGKAIKRLGPGDFFGEIALLTHRPRTATVVAKTPMKIEVIDRREFATMLADAPEVGAKLLETVASRLAETQDLSDAS